MLEHSTTTATSNVAVKTIPAFSCFGGHDTKHLTFVARCWSQKTVEGVIYTSGKNIACIERCNSTCCVFCKTVTVYIFAYVLFSSCDIIMQLVIERRRTAVLFLHFVKPAMHVVFFLFLGSLVFASLPSKTGQLFG